MNKCILYNLTFMFCRCQNIALRKEYVTIVESVKEYNGDVKIFSSLHVSGERMYDDIIRHILIMNFIYRMCVDNV